MKVMKNVAKGATALALAGCICWAAGSVRAEAYEAPAYIYNPITPNVETEHGVTTCDLGVPVMINEDHSRITVQVSSTRDFSCDDETNSFSTPSKGKIYVFMGRWIMDDPEDENKLYCRVGYYTPDGEWVGWAASCAIYY